VIRPNESFKVAEPDPVYYELIGECYIHGMINREAVTFKEKSTAQGVESEDGMTTVVLELR
jgi:hypothetical protein